ncbi:ribonuclease P protein component [Methylobrevis albus]|uniref:Ribonuclease P protein component n=1 Tax=Methylobrevis albus TaxID=2793297 RepID=A0A931HY12_9HYPH|nr:ribonuclease P protein component [Methylobrevis albus]MBH0236402.1 ribonuclease P protein component [Methylobrevis albus]
MSRLKKRAEFLKVARGARTPRRGFLLQSIRRDDPAGPGTADTAPRFGYTVTKKIGNAVERNRIRRRLREAVRLAGAEVAEPGIDYVLVGRQGALSLGFAELTADLLGALRAARKAHRPARATTAPQTGAADHETAPGDRPGAAIPPSPTGPATSERPNDG